ncbi:NTPase [Candidatus Poribacteria bacterium]|nr:NTPase [Candidatus Poribacteria bacterium]
MVTNILITGMPRVGKTTLVREVIEDAAKSDIKAIGFYTDEIRENNKRIGFQISDLDGRQALLASTFFRTKYRVGKYGVNLHNLDLIGIRAIQRGLRSKKFDLILIDEIGKMELLSERFMSVLMKALDSEKPVLATIMHIDNPFTRAIKSREDVELFVLTRTNYDEVKTQVLQSLIDICKGRTNERG